MTLTEERKAFVALAYTRLAHIHKHEGCSASMAIVRKSLRLAVVSNNPEDIDKVYGEAMIVNRTWVERVR